MKKIDGFALVTGASRGLGKEMALRCAADGHNIVVNYTSEKSRAAAERVAAQAREKYGRRAAVIKCDVSKYDECRQMLKKASEEMGERMAILVANAGIKNLLSFDELTHEDYERVISVNLMGVMNAVHCSIPYMKDGKGASIIMISSIAGQMGAAKRADYATTKSAMYGFMKSLCRELGDYGIRVNCIAPGMIMTDMLRNNDPEILKENTKAQCLHFIAEPVEIADAMSYLNTAQYVDGQVLAVNGGWYM